MTLEAHGNHKRRCSCCGKPGRVHDKLSERLWYYVPIWNIKVFLRYAPCRVICPVRGAPTVEAMPWSLGKSPYARAYKIYLARWARHLSWKKTAEMCNASWDAVFRSVKWVVKWGLEHRELTDVTALGVDEIHWGRGKKSANFLTLVYQIDSGSRRLLHVGVRRTQATLREGLKTLDAQHAGFLDGIKVVCSDMWKPYLKVIATMCANAINVLDPFHIAKHLNAAVDEVRRGEQSRLRTKEERARAKGGRFLLLKRSTKVRGKARVKLNAVLASLGATSRAWQLKESFRRFWSYRSPTWAAASPSFSGGQIACGIAWSRVPSLTVCIDPLYPVFVLAFAVIRKFEYVCQVSRDLQAFKMRHWGHDETVLFCVPANPTAPLKSSARNSDARLPGK